MTATIRRALAMSGLAWGLALAGSPEPVFAQPGPTGPEELVSPRMAAVWRAVEKGDTGAVSRLLEEQNGHGPLIEAVDDEVNEVLVTFLWSAEPDTWRVSLSGGLPAPGWYDRNKPMYQVGNSRLWFRTERMPSDSRFQYAFHLNDLGVGLVSEADRLVHGQAHPRQPDPLNPNRLSGNSYLELRDAPSQPYVGERAGVARGSLTADSVWSGILKEYRRVSVYTPPGYEPRLDGYPLLIVFDGEWFGASRNAPMPLPTTLDNLVTDGRSPRFVTVLVENQGTRNRDLTNNPTFADFVALELTPWVRDRYSVTTTADRVVALGFSNGGLAAAYVALRHPGTVGNVVALSAWWAHQDRNFQTNFSAPPDHRLDLGWIIREYAARPRLPLRFYLTVGTLDTYWVDNTRMNRHMRDVLTAKGYPLVYEEFHGGHDFIAIRGKMADGLIAITSDWLY